MGVFRIGDFGSPGTPPNKIERRLSFWSELLNSKNVSFLVCDYREIKSHTKDLIYADPPYPHFGEALYPCQANFGEFCDWLGDQPCPYLLSLPGFRGPTDLTISVPKHLYCEHLQVAKADPFQRINGKPRRAVSDSLYIRRLG